MAKIFFSVATIVVACVLLPSALAHNHKRPVATLYDCAAFNDAVAQAAIPDTSKDVGKWIDATIDTFFKPMASHYEATVEALAKECRAAHPAPAHSSHSRSLGSHVGDAIDTQEYLVTKRINAIPRHAKGVVFEKRHEATEAPITESSDESETVAQKPEISVKQKEVFKTEMKQACKTASEDMWAEVGIFDRFLGNKAQCGTAFNVTIKEREVISYSAFFSEADARIKAVKKGADLKELINVGGDILCDKYVKKAAYINGVNSAGVKQLSELRSHAKADHAHFAQVEQVWGIFDGVVARYDSLLTQTKEQCETNVRKALEQIGTEENGQEMTPDNLELKRKETLLSFVSNAMSTLADAGTDLDGKLALVHYVQSPIQP